MEFKKTPIQKKTFNIAAQILEVTEEGRGVETRRVMKNEDHTGGERRHDRPRESDPRTKASDVVSTGLL